MADEVSDEEFEEFVDDDEVSEGEVAWCSCDGVVVNAAAAAVVVVVVDGEGDVILYCWYCDVLISVGDGDEDENVSVLLLLLLVLFVLLLLLIVADAAVNVVVTGVLSLDGGGRTTMLALRELRCVLRMGAIPSSLSPPPLLLRPPSGNVFAEIPLLRIMLSL